MWSTNLVFSLHTGHSAQWPQPFTVFTLSPVQSNFASHHDFLLAKNWNLQPQKKIVQENLFVDCGSVACNDSNDNHGKEIWNHATLLKIQVPESIGHKSHSVNFTSTRFLLPTRYEYVILTYRSLEFSWKTANPFRFSADEPRKGEVTTCEKAVPQSNVNPPLEISPAMFSAEKTVISFSHVQCFSFLKEKWLHIKILLR